MTRALRMHRRTALSSLLGAWRGGRRVRPGVRAAGKSALNLAMVAEPPTLDIQSTPADLVCIIMQHVYEPLYTFDAKAALVPMLAEIDAQDLGRRQDLQHHAAQGRHAAQRPRPQCRRRGGQPASAGWSSLAARQVRGKRNWPT